MNDHDNCIPTQRFEGTAHTHPGMAGYYASSNRAPAVSNGIRVQWTRRREEHMEAFLTFDQARKRFGLGGTPDRLIRTRISQVAASTDILTAAEELGEPRMTGCGDYQIVRTDIRETEMPGEG